MTDRTLSQATIPKISLTHDGIVPRNAATPTDAKNIPFSDAFKATHCALTFDDGPYDGVSQPLLEFLVNEQIPATFFLVGRRAEKMPGHVKDLVDAGMAIGNHTYGGVDLLPTDSIGIQHPDLKTLSPAKIIDEIERGHQVIASITGRAPKLFRAPFNSVPGIDLGPNDDSQKTAAFWKTLLSLGYDRLCGFSGAFEDWNPHTDAVLWTLLSTWITNTEPSVFTGRWFLMHDWLPDSLSGMPLSVSSYWNRMASVLALVRSRAHSTGLNFAMLD